MGCNCRGTKGKVPPVKKDLRSHLTPQSSKEEVIKAFITFPDFSTEWWRWENIKNAYKIMATKFIKNIPKYPDHYAGRGIVICAGGNRLFTNGYVCMRMLRHFGCKLPIQFWHLENEMDERMRKIVAPFNVECIDAIFYKEKFNIRIINGWELKSQAIKHCPFKEVLLLDADNVPVKDPTFLFDCEIYQKTGALFWPDYWKLSPDREIWDIFETNYKDYPNQQEFESGQILINKEKSWRPLCLAAWMNEYSDYYYKFVHGDKCTFEMAWKRLKSPFYLETTPIHTLDATMCQHDPVRHERLFQHRNLDKWLFDGGNKKIEDFWHEDKCRDFLAELRDQWDGKMVPWPPISHELTAAEAAAKQEIENKYYSYKRVGYDEREVELLSNNKVGQGADRCEISWAVNTLKEEIVLTIFGTTPTCHLKKDKDGIWRGKWIHYEQMPVELKEIKREVSAHA